MTKASEWGRLVALDVVVMSGMSLAAGSTLAATLIRTVATIVAFALAGLYRQRLQFSALDDLPRALLGIAVVVPLGAWLTVPTLLAPPAFSIAPVAWPVAAVVGVGLGRAVGYLALRRRRRRIPGEPTIVIGAGDVAVRIAEVLGEDRTFGLAPLGLVGPPPLTDAELPVPLLGPVSELEELAAEHRPRSVIVAFAGPPDVHLVGTLRQFRRRGITVFVVPRLFELALGRTGAELVHGIPLVRMRPEPAHLRRWVVKRVMDIAGAMVGLMVLAPLLAVCALAVRWESGRAGVLFKQERIGRDGERFTIIKFRSLTPTTTLESQVKWNIDTDARVGRVGRLLRGSSLDELPQLLNVLRGQMSLVGPRPERPFFVEEFQRAYDGYMDRHRVPAGITGWAQIHGLRGDTSIEDRVRFDNYYIENWSLGLDLKIIIRTVGSMLGIFRR